MAWLRTLGLSTARLYTARKRGDWSWHLLNLLALAILAYVLLHGTQGWDERDAGFDAGLESGKWGVRWLLICLSMTPLQSYLRWKGALRLRKPAGLWAFAFAAVHLLLYVDETWKSVPGDWPLYWLEWPPQHYIALGLVSFLLLAALAITSNKWAMRQLGKQWKRLHRVVYGVGVMVIVHALLASTLSKKIFVRDPQAVPELRFYLAVLVVLLTLRVPQVRALLLKRTARTPHAVKVSPPLPSALPVTPHLPTPHLPMLVVDRHSTQAPRAASAAGIRIEQGLESVEPAPEKERELVS